MLTAAQALICSAFLLWMFWYLLRTVPKEHIEDPGIPGAEKAWFRRILGQETILAELESGELRSIIVGNIPPGQNLERTMPGPCQPIWIEITGTDQAGKLTANIYRNAGASQETEVKKGK